MSRNAYKDLGDVIGMPDDEDYKYILKLIEAYERSHPGELRALRDSARDESTAGKNEWGLVKDTVGHTASSLSGHRYIMELPANLHNKIEKYIPTIFREKKHFRWFVKNFPGLVIPKRF